MYSRAMAEGTRNADALAGMDALVARAAAVLVAIVGVASWLRVAEFERAGTPRLLAGGYVVWGAFHLATSSRRRSPGACVLRRVFAGIAAIGAVVGVVAVPITWGTPGARMRRAAGDAGLRLCVEDFRAHEGRLPESLDALRAVCGRIPPDPWGRPYLYEPPGGEHPETFVVGSLGGDGVPGGEGQDADVLVAARATVTR